MHCAVQTTEEHVRLVPRSLSPTRYECYTKCIFQTILTHSINLQRGETRQRDERTGGGGRAEDVDVNGANTCC